MLDSLLEFIEDIVSALQDTHRRISEAIGDFLDALLAFISAAYVWLSEVATTIWDYLTTLFSGLLELGIALLKVSLFYIPSVVMFTIYLSTTSMFSLLIAVAWFMMITSIALFYKKKRIYRSKRKRD